MTTPGAHASAHPGPLAPTPSRSPAVATPNERRKGASLFVKLAAVILSLVVGSIALLAFYFSASQLDSLRHALEAKTMTYGRLVGKQLEPAIAFDDLQTAREVFDSVAQDADIDALALYDARGRALYARGVPSPELESKHTRVGAPELVDLRERVASIVPVTSLEGPTGVLVLESSKRRLAESRRAVTKQALGAAFVTMFVGGLGAYFIARSLAERLRRMAAVADKVAAGDLDGGVLDTRGAHDEIGRLGLAFNAMMGQIRALVGQIRETAQKEQERLEGLVATRTVELDARNDEMRRVLDNVGQGFLSLDLNGRMSRERSAILEQWFGPAPADGSFASYLAQVSAKAGQWFELTWESVTDDVLPLEVSLGQLPRTVEADGQHFAFDYRPIAWDDPKTRRVLVIVTDATAERERELAKAGEQEITRVFSHIVSDRAGTLEFFAEAGALVSELVRPGVDMATFKRALHTLKGNAGLFGLDSLAKSCHQMEDALTESGVIPRDALIALQHGWRELEDKVRPFVVGLGDQLEIQNKDFEELIGSIERGASGQQIRQTLLSWRLEPTDTRLHRIAEQATALALRLDKGPLEVEIESNALRLDPHAWSEFWSAAVHVVRNAIDHGVETPEERDETGKSVPPRLSLRTRVAGDRFFIEFTDDGRGIDWDKVALRASALGLPADQPADLRDALFAEGLSTREKATEISGRGVGLAVAREACVRLGGTIEIDSARGQGTTFRFIWPARVMHARAPRRPSFVSELPATPMRRSVRPHLQPTSKTL